MILALSCGIALFFGLLTGNIIPIEYRRITATSFCACYFTFTPFFPVYEEIAIACFVIATLLLSSKNNHFPLKCISIFLVIILLYRIQLAEVDDYVHLFWGLKSLILLFSIYIVLPSKVVKKDSSAYIV